jgi:aminoglycoside phosphotransferase (APT) family kinase protein
MELLAEGRMAEVFAYGDGRVVKLDRPEWSGVSEFEADVLQRLSGAGLPVARAQGVVTIDGRCGVVLDRVEGRSLLWRLLEATEVDLDHYAEVFAALHATINAAAVEGLPDLVSRLGDELAVSGLDSSLIAELGALMTRLDDGNRALCHFDFHADNVLVGPDGWVVIDWLTVASGPPRADLARSLVLWGRFEDSPIHSFMRGVRRHGLAQRSVNDGTVDDWIRVVAGARLAEGLDEDSAAWLRRVAAGEVRLFA